MIVIVTERLYIVSQKIHSMYVEEGLEEVFHQGKRYEVPVSTIKVQFEPVGAGQASQRSQDQFGVEVKVYSRKKAILLFKDMVSQIREQCPDQVYLDKIAENFLTGEVEDDANTNEICGIGKEKRRSEKVLRRAKRRRK